MVMWLSLLASPASHAVTGVLPSAMSTIVRISSTVTLWLLSQSPTHGGTGGTVSVSGGVGVAVDVRVGVAGVGAQRQLDEQVLAPSATQRSSHRSWQQNSSAPHTHS